MNFFVFFLVYTCNVNEAHPMRHRLSSQECRERIEVQQANIVALNEEIRSLRAQHVELSRSHAAEIEELHRAYAEKLRARGE